MERHAGGAGAVMVPAPLLLLALLVGLLAGLLVAITLSIVTGDAEDLKQEVGAIVAGWMARGA